jgi:CDP-diacylglycerol--glycerol-3-phosphate 3-phosphatidyltransferase/cardiolipin synthase
MKLLKQIPSILSSLRIILALALFYTYLNEMVITSIVIFITALYTDYLDGYLARKLDAATNYGAYLDTVADFILIVTVFLAFIITGIYPYWVLILIIFMFVQFILTSGTKKPIYDPIGKYYGAFLFASAGITLILPLVLPLSYFASILLVLIVLFSFLSLLTRFYSLYKKN